MKAKVKKIPRESVLARPLFSKERTSNVQIVEKQKGTKLALNGTISRNAAPTAIKNSKVSCPFCLDTGRDEDKPEKYCVCLVGQTLFAHEKWQKPPKFRKGEREYDSFPFGKHKGVPLDEVPIDYLQWFYEKGEDKGEGLYRSVEVMLYKRVSELK